jgi:diguanylate cyclase (GGDEF)-like protein/PAS domain S-box-containing protein
VEAGFPSGFAKHKDADEMRDPMDREALRRNLRLTITDHAIPRLLPVEPFLKPTKQKVSATGAFRAGIGTLGTDKTSVLSGRYGLLMLLAAGYFAAAIVCLLLFKNAGNSISLWFANVLAVGILLRKPEIDLGYATPAVFAAALAANLVYGNSVDLSLLFAFVNTLSTVGGTALVRRLDVWTPERNVFAAYVRALILTGILAPAVAGTALSLAAHNLYGWPGVATLKRWFAGDAFAFAMLLPILLFATRENLQRLKNAAALARLSLWIISGAAVGAVAAMTADFPFIFAFLPLAVAAGRNKPFELAIICAASGAALIGTAEITDVPVMKIITGHADGYQFAVAVMMVFPLIGGLLFEALRTERRRISDSEQRFRRVMEDSAIGVTIITLDGHIVEVNDAFAKMLGYDRSAMQGMNVRTITHADDAAADIAVGRAVRHGVSRTYCYEKRYLRRDGGIVWARISGSIMGDSETGAPLYYISQIEDIDARKRSEAAIAEAETRWNFALASAGQGVWEVNLKTNREHYSATWRSILGYDLDDLLVEPGFWLTLVHPDDRDKVAEADKAHMAGLTPHFEAEFRMRHKDGRWIWILDRGKVLERDEAGNALRAIGTHTNITRLKEAEQHIAESALQLADEKERLRVTLEAIGDAVICTDGQDRITFMNPMAEKLAKVESEQAVGEALDRFYRSVDEDSGESLFPAGSGVLDRVKHNSRAVLVRHDGSRCSIREVISPIVTGRNEYSGSVIVFQDVSDARALQRELAYQASHDALTGLANRSSFMQTIQRLVEDVRRSGGEHQLIYLDLDHFKAVNDTSGHAAGDELLKRVTETIRRSLRPGDVAARLGGDEFAIILRSCTDRSATLLAQRLVDRLHALEFSWRGKLHSVGASAGIAPIRADTSATDDIIARADAACYSAKKAGRGRVAGVAVKAA